MSIFSSRSLLMLFTDLPSSKYLIRYLLINLIFLFLVILLSALPSYAAPLNLIQSFGQADLFKPRLISTDSAGNIYTQSEIDDKFSYNSTHYLRKTSPEGIFLGQFISSGGHIAISKDTKYIYESSYAINNTIHLRIYDQLGSLIKTIQINNVDPRFHPDIVVGTEGNIYLSIDKQILVYNQTGRLIRKIKKYFDPSTSTSKAFENISHLAINDKNQLLVMSTELLENSAHNIDRLILIDTQGKLIKPVRTVKNLYDINAIALDNSGYIYLNGWVYTDSQYQAVIKQLKPNGNVHKIIKTAFLSSDIALDDKSELLLIDPSQHLLEKVSKDGSVSKLYTPSPDMIADARDFAVDASNNVYVLDSGYRRIQKFSADGNLITDKWLDSNPINYLSKITISPDDKVYLDKYNDGIDVFTSNGDFLKTYTNAWPSFDKKGHIFQISHRQQSDGQSKYYIEQLDQAGTILKSIPYPNTTNSADTIIRPCTSELVIDSQENIYSFLCEATYLYSHHGASYYSTNAYMIKLSNKDNSILKKEYISGNYGSGYDSKLTIDNRDIIYISSQSYIGSFRTFVLNQDLVKLGEIYNQFGLSVKVDSKNNLYALGSDQVNKYAPVSLIKAPIITLLKQVNKAGATRLEWEDRTDDETEFRVYRCQTLSYSSNDINYKECNYKLIGTAAANTTSLKFPRPADLTGESADYQYFITAVKGQEESLPSTITQISIRPE